MHRLVVLLVALAALAFAFITTSARCLVLINWDNAAYLAEYGVGKLTWSSVPWDAHYAIGNVYLLGVWLAHAFGGTTIDGFRVADAVAFAGGAAVIAHAVLKITGDRLLTVALSLAWATVWVNTFLLVTLEDNVLYFAPAAALVWLSINRLHDWRWRDSLVAGALVGVSVLLSWQAVLYAAPPVYAALIGAPRSRNWRRRGFDAGLVIAAMFATLLVWCLLLAVTSKLSAATAVGTLFRRPNTLGGLAKPLTHGIGQAFSFGITHSAYRLPPMPISPSTVGGIVLALLVAIYLACLQLGRRTRDWRPHLLSASILLLAVVTSKYVDVDYAYLKRYDFVPIIGVFLLATLLAKTSPRVRRAVAALLALVIVGQLALAQRWSAGHMRGYADWPSYAKQPHPEAVWYGRAGQSFYGYFRGIRQRTPTACGHVLALTEAWEGQWNFDQPAALWSELPDHILLGDPTTVARWRAPPRVMSVEEYLKKNLAKDCTWFSADANLLLEPKH